MVPATRLALTVMCKDTSGFKQMTQSANNDAIKLWPNSLVMLGLVAAHIHNSQPQISVSGGGTCRNGSVRRCESIRVFHHCVHRNWLDTAVVQQSLFIVPVAIPLRRSIAAGSSLCHLHYICGGDRCSDAGSDGMDQDRFAEPVSRIGLCSGRCNRCRNAADHVYATKQDIAECAAMDTHDITCRGCNGRPRCLSGVANLQPLKNRAHPHRCSRGSGGLHPDAPFAARDRAE